jgi:hypothetical protein
VKDDDQKKLTRVLHHWQLIQNFSPCICQSLYDVKPKARKWQLGALLPITVPDGAVI